MLDKKMGASVTDELRLPWLIVVGMVSILLLEGVLAYVYGEDLKAKFAWAEGDLINLRTVFYWVAILTLPLTNLIRHVQLRLNQTMPTPTPAKNRYCVTVLVSMVLCESIGLYGLCLYFLGDGLNTLIIFFGIAALGMFLYRPKQHEFDAILQALAQRTH